MMTNEQPDNAQDGAGGPSSPWEQKAAHAEAAPSDEPRKVGCALALGIALLPGLFAWFLLRKGHSTEARLLGFGWAGFLVVFSLATAGVEPPPAPEALAADEASQFEEDEAADETDLAQAEPAVPSPATLSKPAEEPMDEEHRKGFHCLNNWDASHWDMQDAIKQNLRNPDSFDEVQTAITPIDSEGMHSIIMTYRAENGFGGMNVQQAIGILSNETCQLLELQML